MKRITDKKRLRKWGFKKRAYVDIRFGVNPTHNLSCNAERERERERERLSVLSLEMKKGDFQEEMRALICRKYKYIYIYIYI